MVDKDSQPFCVIVILEFGEEPSSKKISSRSSFRFLFIFIDIIISRDIFLDKLRKVTSYQYLAGRFMKPTDILTVLFSHNLWANQRLFEQCAELTNEQMDATISGTYGSIHGTLQHIVLAEQAYFSRISTGQLHRRLEEAPSLTIAEMADSIRTTGVGFIEWAPEVQATDTVQLDWNGTPREVPKTIILTQVINHATEHRSQIMAILTQLGVQPPDLDGWTYFDKLEE